MDNLFSFKLLGTLLGFFAAPGFVKLLFSLFDMMIYQFDRRINIVTKLLENDTLKSDHDTKKTAIQIVNDSLFGLNYLVNVTGEQKNTISNMIDSGLTKDGVKQAVNVINKATGKLGGISIKIATYSNFLLYLLDMIILLTAFFYSFYKLLNGYFSGAEHISFFYGFENLTRDQTLFILMIIFILIVAYWQLTKKLLLRINILRTYDSDGKPLTKNSLKIKTIFCNILVSILKCNNP